MTRRYVIRRCDEGGSLTRPDGTPIEHTWDVVDRETGCTVHNVDTRREARASAREYNGAVR